MEPKDDFLRAFLHACMAGDLLKTQEAIATGRLTAENLDEGLAIATEDAHSDVVAALFDAGARVTDLTVAALPGRSGVEQDPRIVRQYLDYGLDVNGSYCNGIPILVLMSNSACARELISRGADPNRSDLRGVTPLSQAIKRTRDEDISMIDLLLACGAKLELDLLFVAMTPRVSKGEFMTRFLLAKGLDPNSARLNIVKALLDAGADPIGKLADLKYAGASPLQMARNIHSPELQEAILSLLHLRGVDVGRGDGSAEVE